MGWGFFFLFFFNVLGSQELKQKKRNRGFLFGLSCRILFGSVLMMSLLRKDI